MTESQVEVNTWLPVPPSEAFELVTRPARLRRWLIVAGTIDLRVGGEVHLVVAPGAHAVGRVTEIEAGRRFAYTHGWVGDDEMPPGSTSVEVLLEPEDEGTRVTIRHKGLPESYTDMHEGWNDFLARLETTAQNKHNPDDWEPGQNAAPGDIAEAALYALLAALRKVEDTPDVATGSTDFTVTELADHLVENSQMVAAAAGFPALDATTGPVESRAADALWPLVAGLEELEPESAVDLGAHVPVDVVLRYLSVEFLVHAWDITHATHERLDATPELVATVTENARATRGSVFFNSDAYAEPVTVDPGADQLTQLLALTGRLHL
jgi:uncharacterized protein YndB with AHSA1/START domain